MRGWFGVVSISVMLSVVGCGEDNSGQEGKNHISAVGFGIVCTNEDGNDHTDCEHSEGLADYCVPDETGVENAGLERLTCTRKDCDKSDPSTCPEGYVCQEIPQFVREMMQNDRGVNMPTTVCGKERD